MVYLAYGKKLRLMMRASGSDTGVIPVFWRRKRLPRLLMPWRLPTTPCFTLPVAVKRKRFLAPLLVFILGIFVPFQRVTDWQPRQCPWPDRRRKGLIAMRVLWCKPSPAARRAVYSRFTSAASQEPTRRAGIWEERMV